MTTDPPAELFDRRALARHRRRASRLDSHDARFLHGLAAAQVSERLAEVNRTFTDAAVIGPQAGLWCHILAQRGGFPAAEALPDEEILPLEASARDIVIHGLALHWANDPVGQLVQCRRALRPDGLFVAVLLGGQTLHELRSSIATAEAEVEGGLSPRVSPMAGLRDLGGLLGRAGFALPVADSDRLTVTYASPLLLMRELRAMGETNALAGRRRGFLRRETLRRAAGLYRERFSRPDGRIEATFELVFLTGWAPSAGQPRPLRPGSATARLADALGTKEHSAGEKAAPARKKT
ncbi:MAG: methyltransferase domain-containing protein [Paracoccaceae bacterium]